MNYYELLSRGLNGSALDAVRARQEAASAYGQRLDQQLGHRFDVAPLDHVTQRAAAPAIPQWVNNMRAPTLFNEWAMGRTKAANMPYEIERLKDKPVDWQRELGAVALPAAKYAADSLVDLASGKGLRQLGRGALRAPYYAVGSGGDILRMLAEGPMTEGQMPSDALMPEWLRFGEQDSVLADLLGGAPLMAATPKRMLAGIDALRPEPGTLGVFGGIGANLSKTQQKNLVKAVADEAKGVPPEKVWKDRGWFRMPGTNKWAFEISDEDMKLGHPVTDALEFTSSGPGVRVDLPADYFGRRGEKHTALSKAYPGLLSRTRVQYKQQESGGALSDLVDKSSGKKIGEQITVGHAGGLAPAHQTMSHELNHLVQGREGFPQGSSPESEFTSLTDRLLTRQYDMFDPDQNDMLLFSDDFINSGRREFTTNLGRMVHDARVAEYGMPNYWNNAGEAASRASQKRHRLTSSQRRARYPLLDFDTDPQKLRVMRY